MRTIASLRPFPMSAGNFVGNTIEKSAVLPISIPPRKKYLVYSLFTQGEGTYVVACQDPHNAGILPHQELLYDGNGFSLTIEGERHSFQKIDDVPAVIGDPSRYS